MHHQDGYKHSRYYFIIFHIIYIKINRHSSPLAGCIGYDTILCNASDFDRYLHIVRRYNKKTNIVSTWIKTIKLNNVVSCNWLLIEKNSERIEIVVQWNLPCKIYMYEFAFKYTVFPRIVVCKKDPMKMRLPENDNRVGILVLKLLFNEIFLTKFTCMNLLLSIGNYNCKYCSTKPSLQNLQVWIRF